MRLSGAWIGILVSGAWACGSAPTRVSCDASHVAGGTCVEATGAVGQQTVPSAEVDVLQTNCSGTGGVFSDGPCSDLAAAVGGCRISTATVVSTTWYFSPYTTSGVQQACPGLGGTFLTP